MGDATRTSPPVHVRGPEGPWQPVRTALAVWGSAVVHTTWGEWFPTSLTDPALRPLLGHDWQRYRHTADPATRHRFAASRLVTKYAAAAALDRLPAELDLAYQLSGRPYLRGLDLDVSLSHSDELIAVGVSRVGRIGVDTEPADRRLDFDLLSGHICAPGELRSLLPLPPRARERELLRLWTLKEAYSKALGQGLRLGFSEFSLNDGGTGLLAPDDTAARPGAWAFSTHRVLGSHLLSVARHDALPQPPARPAPPGRTLAPACAPS
ncbi:4'-phosphopantetheinyl transferase family protein [Streptomyces sp. NPDC014344]|uniref:4'-phosphopantetheinyl transferase family protein n=1 Tax=Streptomyces sp. NPDC014344 TaxID=3364871 RepID=UPI0036FBA89A